MKIRLLCALVLLTFASACSDSKTSVLNPPYTVEDTGADQNTPDDMDLDQNVEPDLPVDMPTDTAVDMPADAADMKTDEGVDAEMDLPEDMTPDLSLPVDLSCAEHSDCGTCVFKTAPKTLADCYCTACDTEVLPVEICQANQAAWESVCGADDTWQPNGACPQARCIAPKPAACINDVCIDACTQTACPVLTCPLNEQTTPPGECCARCTGANTCETDAECAACVHSNLPTAPSECECPLCPTHPTTQTECQARQAAFVTHCDAGFQATCPVALCLPIGPVSCGDAGYCERNSFECQTDTDCGHCPFAVAPKDASECVCQGCGTAMPNDECMAITQQVNTVCNGFDFDACLPLPCARPPALSCDIFAGGVCVSELL